VNHVLYAAIAVFGALGLVFVLAYIRRGSHPGVRAHGSAASGALDSSAAESARRSAATEAASIRLSAQTEADAIRRSAATEADAVKRAAQSDANSAKAAASSLLAKAAGDAEDALADARRAASAEIAELTEQARRTTAELDAEVSRLQTAQSRLEDDHARLAADHERLRELRVALAEREQSLEQVETVLAADREEFRSRALEHTRELERVAQLSSEQAKAELMAGVEAASRREAAILVRTIENEARADGTDRARAIVVEAVQRVASEQTTETVVSVMHLPSDEMKGRIIGREGRNIRAFESVTGVNVIIDDTPEAVLLSCFDPVRREIGRLTLEKLVLDGRIHPHRIEEVYETSRAEVDQLCLRAAQDALADVGINDLDERLLPTLGRLKYRTSYGQNVLGHLVETAHIAGVMAAELGIEPTLVKRSAFLHDIGKALTHEVEGSHAIIGAELLRRYGESEAVAHAVEAHHNEVQPHSIEAVLTQAADTCSAARPGARRESLESYVKRLARIEEIASSRPGVEKVFAMQAGREVRVMVQPAEIDDLAAQVLAREIAKQIEDELTYPGQIRVTVVRESRSTEIAH
jgi:ribonuclease Y